jgi:hypothetical protein
MKKIKVKPAKGLKVRKTQSEGFKHFKDEGEEVNQTKEVLRLLKYGDLVPIKTIKQGK